MAPKKDKAPPPSSKPAKSGGGKQKKKKWSKGKQKEKVNNQVLFDQGTYDKLLSEAPKFKLITPSILSDRLRINGSLARRAIRELMARGSIRLVSAHISLHLRSNSLPSTQHPFGLQCKEHCRRLKDSEVTSCSSSSSIIKNLDILQDLHECINNLLQLPNSQQDLAGECIHELLDGSLRLLDIFSIVQDWLVQSRESVCELESVIRRRSKAKNGISIEVGKYIASRKQIKKAIIQKALTNLKGFKKDIMVASSSSKDNATLAILEEAELVTLNSLESLLLFINGPKEQESQGKWKVMPKLLKSNRVESCDTNEFEKVDATLKILMNHKPSLIENLHSHMENLVMCIQDLEAGAERLSRQLIRTRFFMNMIMEKRSFSEFMSEIVALVDEVASFAMNPEVEIDAFTEFAMLVEKLAPIFSDLSDKITVIENKPSIRKSLESIETSLSRAKALKKSSSLKDPSKHIEDTTHDIGRSLGLLLLELSTDFREKVGTLQKQFMNARFGGNMSLSSSPVSLEFANDVYGGGEIEEEIVNVTIEDVVLQLKNGNDEEFAVALWRLKEFIRDEKLESCLVNEEAVVAVLLNRLRSCKADNRLNIIQLLRNMASGNDETKEKMAETEFLSAVVKSLTRDAEERREAVGLLLELSDLPAVRRQIGRIQGCIVMLVSILNGSDPIASQGAAKLLDILSSNTQNALHMAEAGYFKPLVHYLKKGSDMNKILMATALSRLVLTDHSKLSLGKDGAIEPLVNMFHTGKLESKLSALNALQNLSSVTENVQLLIRSGIAGSLLQLLFSVTSVLMTLREPASAILARIAQSESIIVNQDVAQQMLSLLNLSSPIIQGHLLEALSSIAAHPRASKVRRKMKEKGALQLILPFLKETNTTTRSKALNLLYTLSKDLTDELSEHLDEAHLIHIVNIVSSSSSDSEKAAALGILSNLPVSDKKVTDILKKANLLSILISNMASSTGSNSPVTRTLAEIVACVIVRFTNPSDKKLQLYSAEQGVIPLLVKLLSSGSSIAKFRAATALAQLSQNSLSLRRSRKSKWFCVNPSVEAYCEVHDGYCYVNSTFCLVKAGAVSALIKILEDKEWEAVEAALIALSTLLQDEICEGGINCIAKNSGVQAIIKILEAGDVKVQEKALWMLDRIFRIEEHRVKYGESAQVFLIDLAQTCDSRLKSTVAKVLAELELLQVQSSYF
ncbi:hypothetical protein AHAS_Ahas13G0071800 [Arachis hypogaea]